MITANNPQSESVLARLRNEAKRTGEQFNLILARYVGFRLLYRLASSRFADQFQLKGATMFLFWFGEMHRPTKDLDLLGTTADADKLREVFAEVSAIICEEDGVVFDAESVEALPIREEQTYGGVRVTLRGFIGKSRIPLQVDIGFGDVVTPAPQTVTLPGMIRDVPEATMMCYNIESSFAEKLEALTKLGLANSRMKDYYDLAKIAHDADLDGAILFQAIRATFKRRGTPLPQALPVGLTADFWGNADVAARWLAFVRKNGILPPADGLDATCQVIAEAVRPLFGVQGTV